MESIALNARDGKTIADANNDTTTALPAVKAKLRPKDKPRLIIGFPLDDIGNGQRFASQHGHMLRYCEAWNCWMIFDGQRWTRDTTGESERLAKLTARRIIAEAQAEDDDDKRANILKHAASTCKRIKREAMLKDAASEPGMSISPESFDANPDKFNLANGTLNLTTFELEPHRADDLLTQISNVAFDAAATCPTWRACMEMWIPDTPTRQFMQDVVGVTLWGNVPEEFWMFLYGDGNNGKSTFIRVLEWLSGDYRHKAQAETFMASKQDGHQKGKPAPEILALKGKRFVTVQEIDKSHRLNAALVKDSTGRDSVTARGCYDKHETTFVPQFTLWMFGNHKPQIKDDSNGSWRRVKLIPFEQVIPEDKRDPELGEKLRAELPGILNWALEGLRRVQEHGLQVPAAVEHATKAYREEMDALAAFIGECCVIGPEYTVSSDSLWNAWCEWCQKNGEEKGQFRAFGLEITRRKHETYRIGQGPKRGTWRRGIGLVSENEPEPTSEESCAPCAPCAGENVKLFQNDFHVQSLSENGAHGAHGAQAKATEKAVAYGSD